MDWGRKDRIAREAAEWAVLVDSPSFGSDAAARFRTWVRRSPDHRDAFLRANRAWTELDQLEALKLHPDIVTLLTSDETESSPASKPSPALDRRAVLAGAGGVLVLGAAGYSAFAPGPAEAFETGVGEQRTVELADGTHVVLNASSRLEARVGGERREVRLLAGEALFAIAENPTGLFSITTPTGAVEAASGEILVKLLPRGARVSVLSEGARVSRRGLVAQRASITVGAGAEVVLGGDVTVDQANPGQLARRLSWRDGVLSFDDTPLAEAAADVTRQTGVAFIFADPALARLRVGGLVRADDVDAFLALLRANLAIAAERRDDTITLSAA